MKYNLKPVDIYLRQMIFHEVYHLNAERIESLSQEFKGSWPVVSDIRRSIFMSFLEHASIDTHD